MVGISGEVVAIARKRVVGRKAPGWLKVEIKNFIGGKGTVVNAEVIEFALKEPPRVGRATLAVAAADRKIVTRRTPRHCPTFNGNAIEV